MPFTSLKLRMSPSLRFAPTASCMEKIPDSYSPASSNEALSLGLQPKSGPFALTYVLGFVVTSVPKERQFRCGPMCVESWPTIRFWIDAPTQLNARMPSQMLPPGGTTPARITVDAWPVPLERSGVTGTGSVQSATISSE
eukprot:4449195-Prymnesium_polylepis.1